MDSLRPTRNSGWRKLLGFDADPCDSSVEASGDTDMDAARQKLEVDRNYDAFVRLLGDLLPEHRDQYALMRDGRIIAFFDKPGDANRAGVEMFPDDIYSIQEVTDEPIDLGFWSHVALH